MLEDIIIIGIVMAITELVKWGLKQRMDPDLVTRIIPLVVLSLAGGFNVVNAAVFGGVPLLQALADGITLGAIAGGVYSLGKAALGIS